MSIFKSMELKPRRITVKRKIKKVLDFYRELILSPNALLTDFLAVKQGGNLDADPLNAYSHICKSKGHKIESGISAQETAFIFGAMEIMDQKPTDVITGAFYANKRNDTVFECGYLIGLLNNIIETGSSSCCKILCVNPSPDMIIELENYRSSKNEYYYAVVDETVAQLYQMEFTSSIFISFDRISSISDINYILITNRDQRKDSWMSLMQGLSVGSAHAKALLLVPTCWFDRYSSGIYEYIVSHDYCVQQALIVDRHVTNSSPRKKICLVLEKAAQGTTFSICNSTYNLNTRWFEVSEREDQIKIESYFKTDISILKIWEGKTNKAQPKEDVNRHQKANIYHYSQEIQLSYRIYAKRKKKYAGIVSYREIVNVDLGIRGRRISKDIERGLRADSKEEVLQSIENIVFDEELYPIIRSDIAKNYVKTNRILTFKTIWFYCREYLLVLKKYDDEFVKSIFALKNEKISDYNPLMPGEVLIAAIVDQLKIPVENLSYKLIEQLYTIFEVACKNRIVTNNPMSKYMGIFTNRASDRQNEVRQALVKKHLTDEEEAKIIEYLLSTTNKDGKRIARCVCNGLLLGALIRLLTGMPSREVAALTWDDFLKIVGFNAYQFRVTKFLDPNGNTVGHIDRGNEKRFRLVPIPRLLAMALVARHKLLIQEGVDSYYLNKCPMVVADEMIPKMIARKEIPHCKPTKINNTCKKLLDKAEIPQNIIILPDEKNELETDIYKSHGDIFLSNYKFKCNHVAGLDNGELCYITGIMPTDTFSLYYCDYSREDIQYGIVKKLDRWLYRYEISEEDEHQSISGVTEGELENAFGPYADGAVMVDLAIHNDGKNSLVLKINSEHGVTVDLEIYKEDSINENNN